MAVDPERWPGYCPICGSEVVFESHGPWHRDQLVCGGCGSIPRQRALILVLGIVRPAWRNTSLWELAPAGPASEMLRRECEAYVGSHFWPDVAPGTAVDGVRCEDVERPSFEDGLLDLVVSSDVFEHVIETDVALAQIARVLRPDGLHVWTTPRYRDRELSASRVTRTPAGLDHLVPPEYHLDPVDAGGALVTFDWGRDLEERVEAASGMATVAFHIESRRHGLLGEFSEVFVSYRGLGRGLAEAMRKAPPQAEMGRLEDRIGQLDEALRTRDATIAAMQGSRSWRLTNPLRAARAAVRRRSKG